MVELTTMIFTYFAWNFPFLAPAELGFNSRVHVCACVIYHCCALCFYVYIIGSSRIPETHVPHILCGFLTGTWQYDFSNADDVVLNDMGTIGQ